MNEPVVAPAINSENGLPRPYSRFFASVTIGTAIALVVLGGGALAGGLLTLPPAASALESHGTRPIAYQPEGAKYSGPQLPTLNLSNDGALGQNATILGFAG